MCDHHLYVILLNKIKRAAIRDLMIKPGANAASNVEGRLLRLEAENDTLKLRVETLEDAQVRGIRERLKRGVYKTS
jgi:hypothetical protein